VTILQSSRWAWPDVISVYGERLAPLKGEKEILYLVTAENVETGLLLSLSSLQGY
jgi:hypothetical protein